MQFFSSCKIHVKYPPGKMDMTQLKYDLISNTLWEFGCFNPSTWRNYINNINNLPTYNNNNHSK